jgi:hypothetical protein
MVNTDYHTTFRIVRDDLDSSRHTTGRLLAGDVELYTLELPWQNNARGESCIPLGIYEVVYVWSRRYGRPMPRLLEVPERDGILIHPGNVDADTEGCVLVGLGQNTNGTITRSREAFSEFVDWLVETLNEGTVGVEISVAG